MLAKGQTHPVMLDAAAEMERFIETYLPSLRRIRTSNMEVKAAFCLHQYRYIP